MLSHMNLMLLFLLLFFHCLECLKLLVSNPEDTELLGQTCISVTLCPVEVFSAELYQCRQERDAGSSLCEGCQLEFGPLLELQSFKGCFFLRLFGKKNISIRQGGMYFYIQQCSGLLLLSREMGYDYVASGKLYILICMQVSWEEIKILKEKHFPVCISRCILGCSFSKDCIGQLQLPSIRIPFHFLPCLPCPIHGIKSKNFAL